MRGMYFNETTGLSLYNQDQMGKLHLFQTIIYTQYESEKQEERKGQFQNKLSFTKNQKRGRKKTAANV